MNLVEDIHFRDEPTDDDLDEGPPAWMDHVFSSDRPETHELIARWRKVLDEYNAVFIGEVQAPITRMMRYYGRKAPMLHMPFNNQVMKTEPWQARKVDASIEQFMLLLPENGWPNWVIGSHDVPRLATRLGSAQARVASLLLLTLPGTPFLYYGDELGMEASEFDPKDAVDPYEKFGQGRDAERGPIPWSAEPHGGFTTGKPWMTLPPNADTCNVEAQKADQRSMLHLHRRLIELRRQCPDLQGLAYEAAYGNKQVLAYYRGKTDRFYVAANFSDTPQPAEFEGSGRILVSTLMDREEAVTGPFGLRPNEAVLVKLD